MITNIIINIISVVIMVNSVNITNIHIINMVTNINIITIINIINIACCLYVKHIWCYCLLDYYITHILYILLIAYWMTILLIGDSIFLPGLGRPSSEPRSRACLLRLAPKAASGCCDFDYVTSIASSFAKS